MKWNKSLKLKIFFVEILFSLNSSFNILGIYYYIFLFYIILQYQFLTYLLNFNSFSGAKERQFLRDLLQPLIKDVLDQSDLDLDVDPLSVIFYLFSLACFIIFF